MAGNTIIVEMSGEIGGQGCPAYVCCYISRVTYPSCDEPSPEPSSKFRRNLEDIVSDICNARSEGERSRVVSRAMGLSGSRRKPDLKSV